jgi:hypothetical protein
MNEELRAGLLERAGRDQAARNALLPGGTWDEWQQIVAPVDQANAARLRDENRARLLARYSDPGQNAGPANPGTPG